MPIIADRAGYWDHYASGVADETTEEAQHAFGWTQYEGHAPATNCSVTPSPPWDYAEGMGLIRAFWDAAVELDPAAAELDEGQRFQVCQPEPLRRLFEAAGLTNVSVIPLEVPTPSSPISMTSGIRSSGDRHPLQAIA